MEGLLLALKKRVLDILFIGLPAAAAVACWLYALPAWMLFICLVAVFFGVISLLGDLGVFGGRDDD